MNFEKLVNDIQVYFNSSQSADKTYITVHDCDNRHKVDVKALVSRFPNSIKTYVLTFSLANVHFIIDTFALT